MQKTSNKRIGERNQKHYFFQIGEKVIFSFLGFSLLVVLVAVNVSRASNEEGEISSPPYIIGEAIYHVDFSQAEDIAPFGTMSASLERHDPRGELLFDEIGDEFVTTKLAIYPNYLIKVKTGAEFGSLQTVPLDAPTEFNISLALTNSTSPSNGYLPLVDYEYTYTLAHRDNIPPNLTISFAYLLSKKVGEYDFAYSYLSLAAITIYPISE